MIRLIIVLHPGTMYGITALILLPVRLLWFVPALAPELLRHIQKIIRVGHGNITPRYTLVPALAARLVHVTQAGLILAPLLLQRTGTRPVITTVEPGSLRMLP